MAVPRMIVFDLDACLWWPEMYMLSGTPSIPVKGELVGSDDEGVVGVKAKRDSAPVKLFPGALRALQRILTDPALEGVLVAAASSTEMPHCAAACMQHLEILPGRTMESMFAHRAIGRSGKLFTSNKVTHFTYLHKESGVPFDQMLFFDDCNWEDNVENVNSSLGVIGVRTPEGLTEDLFEEGLQLFANSSPSPLPLGSPLPSPSHKGSKSQPKN